MKKNRKSFPIFIYVLLLFSVFSWVSNLCTENVSKIPYSQVISLFRQEQVSSCTVEGDTMYLGAATKASTSKDRRKQPYSDELAKPRAFSFKN